MLNDRLKAARAIATTLHTTEDQIDSALLRSHELATAIVKGRKDARVPITIGQESLVELCGAIESLVRARGRIAAAHSALAQDRVDVGLRTFGMGDVSECPNSPASATITHLHQQVA